MQSLDFNSWSGPGMHADRTGRDGMNEDSETVHAGGFDAVIAPLERHAGQRLNGRNRVLLQEAHLSHREGFERCASKAMRISSSSPIGLLVKMVKDGDHRRPLSLGEVAPADSLAEKLRMSQEELDELQRQ